MDLASALIVSCSEKSIVFFTKMLTEASYGQIVTLKSCGEARRLLLEHSFDLVIINAPLRDESGESLSRHIASTGLSQVILVVRSEYCDEVAAATEDDGVLTIANPVNRSVFWQALKLAKSARISLKQIQAENNRLKQQIEDIRAVGRAKCALISHRRMSEQEAHRHIEKQAMDRRATKRAVADEILQTYGNGN